MNVLVHSKPLPVNDMNVSTETGSFAHDLGSGDDYCEAHPYST